MRYLPDVDWSKPPAEPPPRIDVGVATRADLAAVAQSANERQLQIAADHAPIRVTYGRDRIGAQIAAVLAHAGNLVILAVWGEGEIDAVEALYLDDAALPVGVTATHYVGTTGQTADATLIAAYAAQSPAVTYADTLAGIAYSVVVVPPGASQGFPRLTAELRGRLVYDPRGTPATDYSANPALALADLITNTSYGLGKLVDWTSVGTVADVCDALVGGVPRRALGLTLEQPQQAQQWIEALRTYAGCYVCVEGDRYTLIPDRPAASVRSFAHASGEILRLGALKKRGVQQVPTVIELEYTRTDVSPWRSDYVTVSATGVEAGTTPRRVSRVQLPGVQSISQATREATERLNKLNLGDLSFSLEVFDEALDVQVGDVVDVTHPIGMTAKLMRVAGMAGEYGRYTLDLAEYQDAFYSDAVVAEPVLVDTTLPSPAAPTTPTGLVLTEEVYQLDTGLYASRIAATWSAGGYPFLAHYRVSLIVGADVIHTGTAQSPEYRSPAIAEGVTYQVDVSAVSTIGAESAKASGSLLALGKLLVPGNVPGVTTFEAGGRVYVAWGPAIDLDITRYEVRYEATGTAWAAARLIDRVDGLRLQTDLIPTGTWDVMVKALDSVGQYSTTEARASVTVTSDASSFLIDSYDSTAPTLTNMAEYNLGPTDPNRYWVTEDGVALATKMPGALSGYTGVLAAQHAGVTSTWLGEVEDFGLSLSGQWTVEATVDDISGTHASSVGFSPTTSGHAYSAGLSHRTTARSTRLKHEATGAATMRVTYPEQKIRLDAVPREEVGSVTSSAAGATTVTLTGAYAAVKRIVITPEGTTARSATYDNIVLGTPTTFDVYVFNDAGAKIASPCRYSFQGV